MSGNVISSRGINKDFCICICIYLDSYTHETHNIYLSDRTDLKLLTYTLYLTQNIDSHTSTDSHTLIESHPPLLALIDATAMP